MYPLTKFNPMVKLFRFAKSPIKTKFRQKKQKRTIFLHGKNVIFYLKTKKNNSNKFKVVLFLHVSRKCVLFSCVAFGMQTLPVCHEHSTIIEFVQCRACFELKEREGNNNNTNNKQKKPEKPFISFFFLSHSSNVFMQRLLTV